ncbi:MAG TPA: hypothetical protein VLG40_01780 [Candidatus Saccharimonas sp.]|nr:hypothetical protein [Candidatus Saccharimonas sp.]
MDQETQKRIEQFAALTRRHLDQASRCIEARNLTEASEELHEALDFYKEYCASRAGSNQPDVLDAKLEAEMLLVKAIVSSLQKNGVDEELFASAAFAADVADAAVIAVSKITDETAITIYWARLEICIGALRGYFGSYEDARSHLTRARKLLDDLHQQDILSNEQWRHEWIQCECHLAVAYSRLYHDKLALAELLKAAKHIHETEGATQYDLTILVMAATLLWQAQPRRREEAWAILGRAKCVLDLAANHGLRYGFSGQNVLIIERYMSPILGRLMRMIFWRKLRDWLTWPWI